MTASGERTVRLPGRARHKAVDERELPVVGDWVSLSGDTDHALIRAILPRKTCVTRKIAGQRKRRSGGIQKEQVLAANIDVIFIMNGLDRDFNAERIERYCAIAAQSGAKPVIVLNKTDLALDTEEVLLDLKNRIPEIPVHACSAKTGEGLDALNRYVKKGKTIALIGSSGVGKSTLINVWLGVEKQRVDDEDNTTGRGRHITTHRELILMPNGAIVMDNPGMREIQLWGDEDSLNQSFEDFDELAEECRFRDCSHTHEPGCAVLLALEESRIPEARYYNYIKMKKEIRQSNEKY